MDYRIIFMTLRPDVVAYPRRSSEVEKACIVGVGRQISPPNWLVCIDKKSAPLQLVLVPRPVKLQSHWDSLPFCQFGIQPTGGHFNPRMFASLTSSPSAYIVTTDLEYNRLRPNRKDLSPDLLALSQE